MRNGPVVVVVLILAAVFGAWLGPAGERVDPEIGPMEAFFKHVIATRMAPEKVEQIYLSVRSQDPPAALMQRFFGDIRPLSQRSDEGAATIVLESLERGAHDSVRCVGWSSLAPAAKGQVVKAIMSPVEATFVLSPRGKWDLVR